MICSTLGIDLPPGVAEDYMTPFCSILKLGENVKTAALNIATNAVSRDLVPGRSPIAVAAAAIYMASQVRLREMCVIATNFQNIIVSVGFFF